MAPMIDMVFLLLVFFMTVASVAKSQKVVELDLPESDESKIPEDASDRGILSVDAEGNFYIGDQFAASKRSKLLLALASELIPSSASKSAPTKTRNTNLFANSSRPPPKQGPTRSSMPPTNPASRFELLMNHS